MRALRYSVGEAAASLWRGRQSGVLSTATIALALFVLGAFLVASTNLQRLSAEWSRVAAMSIYLDDRIGDADRRAVDAALAPGDVIVGHEYVSKETALARFKQMFSDMAQAVDAGSANPLPASYDVRLRGGSPAAAVDALAARIRMLAGVVDVRYDQQWLNRLASAIALLRGIALVVVVVLSAAAALTVASVVRLALQARHDEIEIMQLVGAPPAFVKGPFVVEGVLQGGIGAIVALAALTIVFFALRGRYLMPLAAAVNLPSVLFLPFGVVLLLVAGGMAVGCIGGVVAAWSR